MFLLYEDGGKFHAGRIMAETDASLQVELEIIGHEHSPARALDR
mgnify:CR=1 FL=1